MIIAVDFDGTIVEHRYPAIGQLAPGAITWLKVWQSLGAKIILLTMRSDKFQAGLNSHPYKLSDALNFLAKFNFTPDYVNDNPEQHSWTDSRKVYANIYVDDAAYGIPTLDNGLVNWELIGPDIARRIQNNERVALWHPTE